MISQVLVLSTLIAMAMSVIVPVKKEYYAPQPYKFGYSIKGKDGEQYREETGDGHSVVKGSYGYVDGKGLKRQVDYVADKLGFRAQVRTNEPGTANQDPAAVKMISTEPYLQGGYGGAGYGDMRYGGAGYGDMRYGGAGYGDMRYGGAGYGDMGYGGVGYGDLGYGGVGDSDLGYGSRGRDGYLGGYGYDDDLGYGGYDLY